MDNAQLKLLQQLLLNSPQKVADPGFAIPYKNPEDSGFPPNNSNLIARNQKGEFPDQDQLMEHDKRKQTNRYAQAADAYRSERDSSFLGMPLHEGRQNAENLKASDGVYNPDTHSNLGFEGGHKEKMNDLMGNLYDQGAISTAQSNPIPPDKEQLFMKLRQLLGK